MEFGDWMAVAGILLVLLAVLAPEALIHWAEKKLFRKEREARRRRFEEWKRRRRDG